MPHPKGTIAVRFNARGTAGLTGTVTLPAGLTGELVFGGKTIRLKGGVNKIKV